MSKKWETKPLGEVCGFVRGPFGGSLKKSIFKKDGYAVYEQQHAIYNQFSDIRYYIDEPKFKAMKRFELFPNDLIMSCSGTMGRVAIVPEGIKRGIINQALLKLTPGKQLLNSFLKIWMESEGFQKSIQEYSGGAAIQNVSSVKILKEIKIPVPTLAEQQRIVALLDQTFAGIATAKTNAQKNFENVLELYESYLNNAFSNELNWPEKLLEDVAQLKGRIGWRGLTAKEYKKSGPLFLSVYSLNYGDYVDFRDAFHISQERYDESPEIMLQKDDVLICKDGAGIGKCGIVGDLQIQTTINSSLLLIRCGKLILPKYLYRYLCSDKFQKIVKSKLDGSTTPHLYQHNISKFPILIPPIGFQREIISKLDNFNGQIQLLRDQYKKRCSDLDELKKSILQKAFAGELTEG